MPLPSIKAAARLAWRHPRYLEHLILTKIGFQRRYQWIIRHAATAKVVPPPLVYKLVLTYRCNLRCTMCYEWGNTGWCKTESAAAIGEELDWNIVSRLFDFPAHSPRPSFILSGGEPMIYSHFGDLADRLRARRCTAIVCTNGFWLDRFEGQLAGNPYVTLLVSLDGREKENDAIRGAGTYRKVVDNIRRLQSNGRARYLGIQFTIRPENVSGMYEFSREMADLGVDWILFNPSWFLSESQALAYERFMAAKFGVQARSQNGFLQPYPIDQEEYIRQARRIRSSRWPMQISFYLPQPEDIRPFVNMPETPTGNMFCYMQWMRMDILPDGSVTPCFLYPDMKVGDLHNQSVDQAWNSDRYAQFRAVRRTETLPVCSKCPIPYLYDAKRKVL